MSCRTSCQGGACAPGIGAWTGGDPSKVSITAAATVPTSTDNKLPHLCNLYVLIELGQQVRLEKHDGATPPAYHTVFVLRLFYDCPRAKIAKHPNALAPFFAPARASKSPETTVLAVSICQYLQVKTLQLIALLYNKA